MTTTIRSVKVNPTETFTTLTLPATVLCHLLGSQTVIFGTAIAVSVTTDGETVGLTDSQLARIQKAFAQKPDDDTISTLVEGLSPFLTIVGMLRNVWTRQPAGQCGPAGEG